MLTSTFIDRDQVVKKLIRLRCKLADKESKNRQKQNFYLSTAGKKKEPDGIYLLFPPRGKWCKLGAPARQELDGQKRNERSLFLTYLKAKKGRSEEDWYRRLCDEADKIVRLSCSDMYKVQAPDVKVIEKKKENTKIQYRPICIFKPLQERMLFSLLNSFLTRLFDPYFLDCSYAFRKPDTARHNLQHLDAVEHLRNYRKLHPNQSLFVAECDMQKFYDTIRHDIIKQRFCTLLRRAIREGRIDTPKANMVKYWFYQYVDCFDFEHNVLIHNKKASDHRFWKKKADTLNMKPYIGWVDALIKSRKWRRKKNLRRGIPQGGALSGLIANVVMHTVDQAVMKSIGSRDMTYCRFCDDMILVGADSGEVEHTFDVYNRAIGCSALIAHPNRGMNIEHMRDFWKGKTRGPYEWSKKGKSVYPWITFVGFDINWQGCLRIRKASVKRHIKKQNMMVGEMIYPIRKGRKPRFCKETLWSSLQSRLIAAGVGRINMRNYENNSNHHSWMSAFSLLDKNPWSVKQLKMLDRHRYCVLSRAYRVLNSLLIEWPRITKADTHGMKEGDRYAYKGNPFSYYGQCFDYRV